MKNALWIACSGGCGNDMQFKAGPPTRYECPECGHVDQRDAVAIASDSGSEDGIIEQLGLYDDLLHCVFPDEPWVEYGIVEYRYRVAFPAKFRDLVAERGHRNFPVGTKTASKLIGQAMGLLYQRGLLVQHAGTAGTGFWSYNDPSNWYALPPGPSTTKLVTWEQFLSGALDGVVRDEAVVMSDDAIRNATPDHAPRSSP